MAPQEHSPARGSTGQGEGGGYASDAERKRMLPWVIATLILSMLMSSLNQMIFVAALPTIVGELGGANHISWVISGFLLGQTIALPIIGKLGDQIGRKGLFLGATVVFVIGSLLGGSATSIGVLIAARIVQGLAAGSLMTLSQAITAEVTTSRERGRYMGFMFAAFGVASVLGPVLGGWFTDGPGWRWGLYFNVPLGAISLVSTALLLKLPRRPKRLDWDVPGTIAMIVATSSLIVTVTFGGNQYEWTDPVILTLAGVFIVSTLSFLFAELHSSEPLIALGLFRKRNFLITTLCGFGVGIFLFGTLAYLPTYMQMVHMLSPTNAGLMMVWMIAGMMATSITTGQIISRTGSYKWFPVVGLTLVGVMLVLISGVTPETPLTRLGFYMLGLGVGIGMTMQILLLIVQNAFPLSEVGVVTSVNNFFRQTGGAVGTALVGSVLSANLAELLAERVPAALGDDADPGALPDASSLTPDIIDDLPPALAEAVTSSYNDALMPEFLWLAPLAFVCAAALLFIRNDRLKETID